MRCSLLLLTLLFLLNSCTNSETKKTTKKQQIEELLTAHDRYGDLNVAVLISTQGQEIYKNAFGYANREWKVANHPNTKFRIASITKQFTAMLIVQLAQDKRIDLNAPIAMYLPQYPVPQANLITPHHLLTHSSGIYDYAQPPSTIERNPNRFSPINSIQTFADSALKFTPGEQFEYSNSGYDLLAYLAEKITDSTYQQLLQSRIFDPVGMKNTGLDNHREVIENRAHGYFKMWGTYSNANYINMKKVYASGGIYSTVEDLFLWDRALASNQLLSTANSDLLFTPFMPDSEYHGSYGYGWEIGTEELGNSNKRVPVQQHDGVINGFCGLITRIPDSQSSIILLSNNRRAPLNTLTRAILGVLYNETYDSPKKSVIKETQIAINKNGLPTGIALYNTIKLDTQYYLSEQEFIIAGYDYLHANDAQVAATIFKFAIEEFPNKDNPYDSYAEAQMALGNLERALINYKKSLKINPQNKNAEDMIIKIKAARLTDNWVSLDSTKIH